MIRRMVTAMLSIGVLAGMMAVPAAAHVTVGADDATQGGFSVLTFRVPNEESNAETVGLKVQLPIDHPIPFVSVQPKEGWKISTKTTKLDRPIESEGGTIDEAVTEIEWTGGRIGPGQFDEFRVQAGPLPTDTDSLTFKAIQTYEDADGTIHDVGWIEESTPGGPEPEHPAPVLTLAPAGSSNSGAAHDDQAAPSTTAPTVTAQATDADSDPSSVATLALIIAIAGLAVAVIALVIAVVRKQKPAAETRASSDPPSDG